MAAYFYFKLNTKPGPKLAIHSPFWRWLSLGLITLGVIFFAAATAPIAVYELKEFQSNPQIVSPVVLGESLGWTDYDNPHNWFSVAPLLPPRSSKITHYSLSIPKLKINHAVVQIGGEDLMKSLIQYPGTAFPGQFGNAVIFGHSVLPQFFNPTNYKTIFSTLPTLEEKDEVLVNFDGILYRYLVVQLLETNPEDVTVLEQRYDDRYLSLITCVPPGTYLKRLIVKARLVSS